MSLGANSNDEEDEAPLDDQTLPLQRTPATVSHDDAPSEVNPESSEEEELDEDELLARLAASRRAVVVSDHEEDEVDVGSMQERLGGANEGPSGVPGNDQGGGSEGDVWDDWGGQGRRKGKGKGGPKARGRVAGSGGDLAPKQPVAKQKGSGGAQPRAPVGKQGKWAVEDITCGVCGRAFASRTKLFAHIKAEGHAQAR